MLPAPHSEYDLLWSAKAGRLDRYLLDVLIPSLPDAAPAWVPEPFSSLFFHQSAVLDLIGRDPTGTFAAEQWLFVNGILTNQDVARINAEYLFDLFGRPITPLWDCTDGIGFDLLECASEELGATDQGVENAFHPLLDALADVTHQRVVLIAHSRGTLITSVLLRLIGAVYRQTTAGVPGQLSQAEREAIKRYARTEGVHIHEDRLKPVAREHLAKLEVYCFANCAGRMTYIDERLQLPWIESFGNQHDLVARLGMLAPEQSEISISGPCFRHDGAWGHLLNAHYLRAIDQTHPQGSDSGAPVGAAPYVVIDGTASPNTVPRLFSYLRGANAIDPTPGAVG
jgi:hypothetical protein